MRRVRNILFTTLLVFLPSQLGLHMWPEWSIIFGRRVDYLSPTIYFTDVLVVLLFLMWIIDKKIYTRIAHVRRIFFRSKYITVVVIFFSSVVLNILFSTSAFVSLYYWLRVCLVAIVALYVFVEKPTINTIRNALLVSILYTSILGLWQQLAHHSVGGVWYLFGERSFSLMTPGIARIDLCSLPFISLCGLALRSYSTFSHPNIFAGYTLSTLVFIFVSCIKDKTMCKTPPLWYRVFVVCVFVFGILAIVVSYSRAVWFLCFVLCIFALLYVLKSRVHRMVYAALLCVSVFVFFVFCLGLYFTFMSSSESVVVRLGLLHISHRMFFTHSLFGVGLGGFIPALKTFSHSPVGYLLQPVHNVYALWLAETGLFGVFVLGISIYTFIARYKKYQILPGASFFGFSVLLILGFVDHYPTTMVQMQYLAGLFIGMIFLAGTSYNKQ